MNGKRVAIITGAGSGINREVARLLARDMTVAVCDLDLAGAEATVELITADGGDADAWHLDVADRERVQAAIDAIAERHDRPEVLVNGAGYGQFADFLELTSEQWDRMIAVNLTGTFNCTQAVVPQMRAANYGRIICFSSVGALSGSPQHSHYAAAKAGVIGFSKALCKEIGPWGITINCVAPGAIDTPFLDGVSEEAMARTSATPVGRIGQPGDIAAGVRYLASPEAGFITGAVLNINGGAYV